MLAPQAGGAATKGHALPTPLLTPGCPGTRLVYRVLPAEPPLATASRWAGRPGLRLPAEAAAGARPAPLTAAADPAAGYCPPSLGPAAQQAQHMLLDGLGQLHSKHSTCYWMVFLQA